GRRRPRARGAAAAPRALSGGAAAAGAAPGPAALSAPGPGARGCARSLLRPRHASSAPPHARPRDRLRAGRPGRGEHLRRLAGVSVGGARAAAGGERWLAAGDAGGRRGGGGAGAFAAARPRPAATRRPRLAMARAGAGGGGRAPAVGGG